MMSDDSAIKIKQAHLEKS